MPVFDTSRLNRTEQLDNVGLIHMNGRVYDPKIAHFKSADPILQAPAQLQPLYLRVEQSIENDRPQWVILDQQSL
jgi:hypothetical protein